ncbi:MAG: hypothetical protein IH940_13595 [Acidobacteria bacterium]|nr:hypothetical protein [Acidobacteriota bacterium]
MNDRGFSERTHAHTVLYDYLGTQYRDEDPVPVELALDHGYAGMVSVAVDLAEGVDQSAFDAFNETKGVTSLLAGSSVASCASWRPIALDDVTANAPMDLGTPPGGDNRVMQLFFVESDVRDEWQRFADYADAIRDAGVGNVVSAAPFFRTVVGTDTYVDEIW